ncbi:MAG: N-acetylmuramoyl-L-alanine amidase [candidate division KSB1 bacterium]|nr:N-acetylmuramoyl-L-alanine amidase [candidate division KSB1 bacterium]
MKVVQADGQSIYFQTASLNDPQLSIKTYHDILFISVDDIVDLLKVRSFYSGKVRKVVIYIEERSVKVTAFNPFVVVGDDVFQLSVETIQVGDVIYVPIFEFFDIIRDIIPDNIAIHASKERIDIRPSSYVNVKKIEFEEKANGTLIKIAVSKQFTSNEVRTRDRHGWLYVDIYGGIIDVESIARNIKKGLVASIMPLQLTPEMTQIGFRLRKPIIEKQLFLDDPDYILLSLKTRDDVSVDINNALEQEKKKWLIDRIVIDPGHGGKDPGAIGTRGTYEKNVVLAISRELRRILERESDIDVLMTRDDDTFVELKKRAELANSKEAKLFISIHANSNNNRGLDGVSTYFLGIGNTEEAREVALLENSVIKYENEENYADLSHENFILSSMAQNMYARESQDFAAIVQKEISGHCGLKDRGVRQAGFVVLWNASMPNILIETAFLSNRQDEAKLTTRSFQKKMARAIFNSIMSFKEKYEDGF